VARQVWRAFCRLGIIFVGCRRGRGTGLIDKRDIVPVDEVRKRHWRSVGVQVLSKEDNYHGANILLRVAARVRVPD